MAMVPKGHGLKSFPRRVRVRVRVSRIASQKLSKKVPLSGGPGKILVNCGSIVFINANARADYP